MSLILASSTIHVTGVTEPVAKWVKYCQNMKYRRGQHESWLLIYLRTIIIRFELRDKFKFWKLFYRCRQLKRKHSLIIFLNEWKKKYDTARKKYLPLIWARYHQRNVIRQYMTLWRQKIIILKCVYAHNISTYRKFFASWSQSLNESIRRKKRQIIYQWKLFVEHRKTVSHAMVNQIIPLISPLSYHIYLIIILFIPASLKNFNTNPISSEMATILRTARNIPNSKISKTIQSVKTKTNIRFYSEKSFLQSYPYVLDRNRRIFQKNVPKKSVESMDSNNSFAYSYPS